MNTPQTSRLAGGSTPRLAGDTSPVRAGTVREGAPPAQAGMTFSQAGDEAACFALWREQVDPVVVARFTIDGEPVSKARARFTKQGSKRQAYTPQKTRAAEEIVAWKFRAAAPRHRADSESTYGVMALFFSGTRQRRDVDNMLKLILDGLNKVAWADDDQVVEVSGRKSYEPRHPEHARTEVVVYKVGAVQRKTARCENCQHEFATYSSTTDRRFCSRECSYAWRRDQRRRRCQQCGEEFSPKQVSAPPKFCSRKCADNAKRATVTCTRCGTTFTKQRCHVRSSNFCAPECRDAHAKAQRTKNSRGTCASCGGPTSKKTYQQCRSCKWGGTPVSGAPETPHA